MMSIYKFIDYLVDENTDDVYVDRDYRKLMDVCQQYSEYFSYIYHDGVNDIVELKPFIYKQIYTYHWPGTWRTNEGGIYRIYFCNHKSITILKERTRDLFGFNDVPEDITFYRKDKSIFMETISHEGECFLFPKPGEDISDVISKNGWIKTDDPIDEEIYF